MSYEIMYDRKFIRTTRGFIPMILSGSNNCTEQTWDRRGRAYERRERHWWAWFPQSMPFKDLPETDFLKQIDVLTKDTPNHELFMWNSHWLTDRQWRKWFQNGCKSALSLEEYKACNRLYSFVGYIIVYHNDDYPGKRELERHIHTTEELETWLDEANTKEKEIRAAATGKCTTYISLAWDISEPLDVPTKAPVGAVLAKNGNAYVKEYVKDKQLTFTGDPFEAMLFASVEEAKSKIGSCWRKVRFVQAQRQRQSRNYVLKIQHGTLQDKFIRKRSKNCLFVTWSADYARRFHSQSEAMRYAEDASKRFEIGDTIMVVNVEENTEEEIRLREGAT